MDVVCAFVGIDHLQIHHVTDDAEFVGNAVAAEHVARTARDVKRLAAGIALHDRGDLDRGRAVILHPAEAQNAAGELYGFGRLQDLLVRCQRERAGATAVVQAVEADVLAFAGGAEPSDDLTLLALRWHGPAQTEAA